VGFHRIAENNPFGDGCAWVGGNEQKYPYCYRGSHQKELGWDTRAEAGSVGNGRYGKATLLHSPANQVLAEISERHIKYEGLQCHFCKVTAEVIIILSINLTALCPLCHYYAGSLLPW